MKSIVNTVMLKPHDAVTDMEVGALCNEVIQLEKQLAAAQAEVELLQEVIIRLVGSEQGERLLHKCRVIVADKARRR